MMIGLEFYAQLSDMDEEYFINSGYSFGNMRDDFEHFAKKFGMEQMTELYFGKDLFKMIKTPFFPLFFTARHQQEPISVITQTQIIIQIIEEDIFQSLIMALLELQQEASEDRIIFKERFHPEVAQISHPTIHLQLFPAGRTQFILFPKERTESIVIDHSVTVQTSSRHRFALSR